MKVVFKPSSRELLKVGELGDSIAVDDFHPPLDIVTRVLTALKRDWEKLPLRYEDGAAYPAWRLTPFKEELHSMAVASAKLSACQRNRGFDAEIYALKIQRKRLKQPTINHGQDEPSLPEKLAAIKGQIDLLRAKQEYIFKDAMDKAMDRSTKSLEDFLIDKYVLRSDLAAWLSAEHGFDCQIAASSITTDDQSHSLGDAAPNQVENQGQASSIDQHPPADANQQEQPDTAPSGVQEKTAPEVAADDDAKEGEADANLANLFDTVRVAQLEAMFPDGGRWEKYADRAHRNGLKAARVGPGQFNPYLAARWWLTQGPDKWDLARCMRKLANNLPARSMDSKHVLTGDSD